MASFLPRYRKKHEMLARRESALKHSLAQRADAALIRSLANDVRLARIRALKEKHAQLPPNESPKANHFHKIEDQIRLARQATVDDILQEFMRNTDDGQPT